MVRGSIARRCAGLIPVAILTLSACGGAYAPASAPAPPAHTAGFDQLSRKTPIRHVIVVVQENRSFDNLFAGYPGADSAMTGKMHDGETTKLKAISFAKVILTHSYATSRTDMNGGAMNGFDQVPPVPPFTKYEPYKYVQRSLIKPYWDLASQYVLADHMFPTELGPSFTAHLNLIAGTTTVAPGKSIVDLPYYDGRTADGSCDDPAGTVTNLITSSGDYLLHQGPFPCFSFHTLAGPLDDAGVSWKYYNDPQGGLSLWNAFDAIKEVRYGKGWSNVIKTPKQVLQDAASGNLAGVSWVIPTMQNSDHPEAGSKTGPSWVASVVNAIGTGPDWNTSAIVILWDDWGGWYDNVAPPQLDYRGLGLRVPCLIVSPYAKKGYVEHQQYEFGSILKTIEQIFGLETIGTTDRRAASMLDAFDFKQSPRPFKPIQADYSPSYFLNQKPTSLILDD